MNIREYQVDDYEQANALSIAYGQNKLPQPSKMGGYALVAEEEGKIEGFVWALTAPVSSTALIDYFFVKEERRDKGVLATLLMSRMLVDLMKKGKNNIVGVIKEEAPHAESLARLYRLMGMDVSKAYLITGDAKPIIDHMMKAFNGTKQ